MRSVLRHPLRVLVRSLAFLGITGAGVIEHAWRFRRVGLGNDPKTCAAWVQRWSRRSLSRVGIRVEAVGTVPTQGILVCNHLGYLDIGVIAICGPMVFVSKAEVARWPFMGSLARCAGTLFLRRDQRAHVAEISAAFRPIVEGGTVVAMFPEGTSSGGDSVLPFRPSLLEPAAANGWPVTPACIRYEVSDGLVSEDVAYWREMTFAPHFLNLMSKRWIVARVEFGNPIQGIRDRKELSRRLHGEVSAMLERRRGNA
ncbi:MAG: lysophospholipid acyltransferase family protein [Limisphaerales bacterium]